MHGIVDEKTDVFSFGVFLLEITSGRKPVDGSNRSLLSWVSATFFCSHCDPSRQSLTAKNIFD